MTATETEADTSEQEPAAPPGAARKAAGRVRRTGAVLRNPERAWHYFGIPVLVAAALLALWTYLSGVDLPSWARDSHLSREFLTARATEHVTLSLIVTFFVLLIAVPLGIILTRSWAQRFTPYFIGAANAGQAVPSIGVLVLLAILLRPGDRTVVIAVTLYCLLPVLRNTMVGIYQVDSSIIEAARGMGMTRPLILWRIELPLAVPVMLAGIRTALILAVGTITLGALVGGGSLGRVINAGIVRLNDPVLISGAVLTAALALMIDWVAGIAEDVLRPRGL